MAQEIRASRLFVSSAIKRCRRRSTQPACHTAQWRTMHAQTSEVPQLEMEDVGATVIPFRPRSYASKPLRHVEPEEQSRPQVMQTSNGDDIAQTRQFPLYRAELHFKLAEPNQRDRLPKMSGSLSQNLADLEDEVPRLAKQLDQQQKLQMSESEVEHLPELTEEELVQFYQALESWSTGAAQGSKAKVKAISGNGKAKDKQLAAPEIEEDLMLVPANRRRLGRQARKEILTGLIERLQDLRDAANDVTNSLAGTNTGSKLADLPEAASRTRADMVASPGRLEQESLDLVTSFVPHIPSSMTSPQEMEIDQVVSTGLLRKIEWDALFESFTQKNDFQGASQVLESMRKHGSPYTEQRVEDLLRAYAKAGDPVGLSTFLKAREQSTGIAVPKRHLEYVVEAHLACGDKSAALQTLHHFEDLHNILPQRAYTRVISSYIAGTTRRTNSLTPQADKALAWDVFAHMRLVAHPVPSRSTYNAILLSCADPQDPQPERALDLLIEMEQDSQITPDGETFDAAILACSRVKGFYLEGFKLLKRMLGMHQSALSGKRFMTSQDGTGSDEYAATGYEPTLATFNALLEGCKRRGDLSRTRWLLGEVLRLVQSGAGRGVDEEMIVNVLQCYAAFEPVIKREAVKVSSSISPDGTAGDQVEDADAKQAQSAFDAASELDTAEIAPTGYITSDSRRLTLFDIASADFKPPSGPQTSLEALQEAERLFQVVLHSQGDQASPFRMVKVSTRIVNAYLSVKFSHGNLSDATETWQRIWEEPILKEAGVSKNGWTYISLFERCASAKQGDERSTVAGILTAAWQDYLSWNSVVERQLRALPPQHVWATRMRLGGGPRQVEKAWIHCIRTLALLGRTRDALDVLEGFRARHSPEDILLPSQSSHREQAKKARVRLSSASTTLEDAVPPHILFHDISILHQRLVRHGDLQGIGALKWTCLSYQKALETRRSRRLRK